MRPSDSVSRGVPPAPAAESSSDLSDVDNTQTGVRKLNHEAQDLVGVSISRAQTRLASPTAPSVDQSKAFETQDPADRLANDDVKDALPECRGGIAAAVEERPALGKVVPASAEIEGTEYQKAEQEPPPKLQSRSPRPKSGLPDLNLKRFLPSLNLPSAPKAASFKDFSFRSLSGLVGDGKETTEENFKRKRASTFVPSLPPWSQSPTKDSSSSKDRLHAWLEKPEATSKPSMPLRRSASDHSLFLGRVASTGSSLGDDSRWEHVQDQVNSRFKAVKDTWQDTTIMKMPKVPSMSLAGLRPEFLRSPASSDPRWTKQDSASRFTSLEAAKSLGNDAESRSKGEIYSGMPAVSKLKATHPNLFRALEDMTGDLVVLGGYRGSILRSAEPPHRQLWVPVKVGLNIRKVDLEVGLNPEDEENMERYIIPGGMLSHIGPIDMGRRLLRKLRHCRNVQEDKLRIHEYSYDWRLSPHLLSRRLLDFLGKLPCNAEALPLTERGTFVIAHSLGGLITRHATNQEPHLFAGVIYAGVPQHCINILGPLRNDDKVLLSSKVLTAQVNFSFRSTFLLLPESGFCFVDKSTKESYHVDFFNADHWKTYALSPCITPTLPPPDQEKKTLLETVTSSLPSFPSSFQKAFSAEPAAPPSSNGMQQRSNTNLLTPAVSNEPQAPISTIPVPLTVDYLDRTLAATLQFKHEMEFLPSLSRPHQNLYPPLAIIYGTSVPTVSAARVKSREAIKYSNAYDDLQFGSGDGVCLARAAMLPKGYECSAGGRVRTEKGHVGLLGDLDAVGKCLVAVMKARKRGVGLGEAGKSECWEA